MSTTTTPNLGLVKSGYNTEKDDWGAHINDSFDLIDAKVPVLLASGAVSGATLDLALPSTFRTYELRIKQLRTAYASARLFARLSVGGVYQGSGYSNTYYGYAGSLVSLAGSNTAIYLTSELQSQATIGAGQGAIRISSVLSGSTYRNQIGGDFEYPGAGGMGWVRSSGRLDSPTGHLDGIHLGLDTSGGFDKELDAKYALFGIPGLG